VVIGDDTDLFLDFVRIIALLFFSGRKLIAIDIMFPHECSIDDKRKEVKSSLLAYSGSLQLQKLKK
jgi:hypothetical protein